MLIGRRKSKPISVGGVSFRMFSFGNKEKILDYFYIWRTGDRPLNLPLTSSPCPSPSSEVTIVGTAKDTELGLTERLGVADIDVIVQSAVQGLAHQVCQSSLMYVRRQPQAPVWAVAKPPQKNLSALGFIIYRRHFTCFVFPTGEMRRRQHFSS